MQWLWGSAGGLGGRLSQIRRPGESPESAACVCLLPYLDAERIRKSACRAVLIQVTERILILRDAYLLPTISSSSAQRYLAAMSFTYHLLI